jgi:hypothetical protein
MKKQSIRFYDSILEFLKSKKKAKIMTPIIGVMITALTACTPTPKPDPDPDPDPIVEFDPTAYIEEKTGEVEIAPGVKVDLQEFKQKEGLSFYFAEPFTKAEIDEMYKMYQPFYEELYELKSKQGPNDAVKTDMMGMNHNSSESYLIGEELGKILSDFAKKVYTSNDPMYKDYKQFIEVTEQQDKTKTYFFKSTRDLLIDANDLEKKYTIIFFRFMRDIYMNQIYPKLGITYKCDICDVQKTSFNPMSDYQLNDEFLAELESKKHL